AARVNNDGYAVGYSLSRDAGDKRCRGCGGFPDADHARIARDAIIADVDVVAASSDVQAGVLAQGNIIHTSRVISKCPRAIGCVGSAGSVIGECALPGGCVVAGRGVIPESSKARGGVT